MAGSKSVQMIESDVVGVELIRLGWCQGSVLKATSARKTWLALNTYEDTLEEKKDSTNTFASPDIWNLQQESLDENDFLIVVSQTCDIQKSPKQEPYVEVIRAYWTSERSIMHEAGKNSARRFLIQRRTSGDGKVDALIADATVRIQIEKAALLALTPLDGFKENDTITPRNFRQWLARRYNRPALPDSVVNAVQKPIVKAIDKLHEKDDLHRILDGISEILFLPRNEALPYQVDMLFIRDERYDAPIVSEEDTARLAGWIADMLKKGRGAELAYWEILSIKNISVYDYSNAFELPLDYYSLAQDDSPDY
jgi:hypothetical protein